MYRHTHTHTRLTALCAGLPRWAGTGKVKTNLDFTEARDSEWQWHQLSHMQVCTSLQTDNHANTPLLSFFTGRMPFLLSNQQRQSTEGKLYIVTTDNTRLIDWLRFCVPLLPKCTVGHFGDVLPRQSLGSIQKNAKPNKTNLDNTKPKSSELTHKTQTKPVTTITHKTACNRSAICHEECRRGAHLPFLCCVCVGG